MSEEYGPLQNLPAGFVSFFGLQNSGRAPQTVSSMLQPNLELSRWYLAQERRYNTDTQAVNAATSQAFAQSAGELEFLIVEHWSVYSAALTAGQTLQIVAQVSFENSNALEVQFGAVSNYAQAGEIAVSTVNLQSGYLILPPRAQLSVRVLAIAAGPINVSSAIKFTSARSP